MSKRSRLARKFRLGNLMRFRGAFGRSSYLAIVIDVAENEITVFDQKGKIRELDIYAANKGTIVSKPYKRNKDEEIN